MLIFFNQPAASFLGLDAAGWLIFLGIVLVSYSVFPLWAATGSPIKTWAAQVVITLDILWIAGSVALIFGSFLPLTTPGKWAAAVIADVVLLFAIVQYIGLRRQTTS